MNRVIKGCVLSLLGLVSACNIEDWDDECEEDDVEICGFDGCKEPHPADDDDDDDGGSATPHKPSDGGAASTGGSSSAGTTASGGSSSAGSPASGGSAGKPPAEPVPTPCDQESDCDPGFNCSPDTHECTPTDQETCGELRSELSCGNRVDCTPIYAGTGCSCGQDCECVGGEPGCICESFAFFVCEPVPAE